MGRRWNREASVLSWLGLDGVDSLGDGVRRADAAVIQEGGEAPDGTSQNV